MPSGLAFGTAMVVVFLIECLVLGMIVNSLRPIGANMRQIIF
jgi:hypothetical protein